MNLTEVLLGSPHEIIDNLDDPIVVRISNSSVAVAADFLVELGDGGGKVVRVKVPTGGGVDETNDVSISKEDRICFRVDSWLFPGGCDDPLVVVVFVVVARHLLLLRTDGVRLDVRMEESSTVSHALEGDFRAQCRF